MVSLTPKKMGVQAIGKSCSMGLKIGRMPENRGFEQQELLSQAPKSIKKCYDCYEVGFILSPRIPFINSPMCFF